MIFLSGLIDPPETVKVGQDLQLAFQGADSQLLAGDNLMRVFSKDQRAQILAHSLKFGLKGFDSRRHGFIFLLLLALLATASVLPWNRRAFHKNTRGV